MTDGQEQYNFNNCVQFILAAVNSLLCIQKQSPCQNQITSPSFSFSLYFIDNFFFKKREEENQFWQTL